MSFILLFCEQTLNAHETRFWSLNSTHVWHVFTHTNAYDLYLFCYAAVLFDLLFSFLMTILFYWTRCCSTSGLVTRRISCDIWPPILAPRLPCRHLIGSSKAFSDNWTCSGRRIEERNWIERVLSTPVLKNNSSSPSFSFTAASWPPRKAFPPP